MSYFQQLQDIYDSFGRFQEDIKKYSEDISYNDLPSIKVAFDSSMLDVQDISNLSSIAEQQSRISRMIYAYGNIYEAQNRVLQQLEDEFEMWEAKQYSNLDSKDKSISTEGAKHKFIMVSNADVYNKYSSDIRNEKYKLGMLKRTIDGLNSFSFKLDAIQRAQEAILKKM